MRLVEKRCPKCGAGLSFDSNSREVTCKYCNTSFEIVRDGIDNNLANDLIDPEFFRLNAKIIKKTQSMFSIGFIFTVIVVFLMTFIFMFGIISHFFFR